MLCDLNTSCGCKVNFLTFQVMSDNNISVEVHLYFLNVKKTFTKLKSTFQIQLKPCFKKVKRSDISNIIINCYIALAKINEQLQTIYTDSYPAQDIKFS